VVTGVCAYRPNLPKTRVGAIITGFLPHGSTQRRIDSAADGG